MEGTARLFRAGLMMPARRRAGVLGLRAGLGRWLVAAAFRGVIGSDTRQARRAQEAALDKPRSRVVRQSQCR